jgi:hypothetical protein
MTRLALLCSLTALLGCRGAVNGFGAVCVYNGTDQAAEVKLTGSTPVTLSVRPNSGEIVRDCVAGTYQIAISKKGGFPQIVATEIVRDRLTLVNVDGAACFARANIVGLYGRGGAPVRLSQLYRGEIVSSIPEEIGVLPGEHTPPTRPASAEVFFRVDAVPCELTDEAWKVEEYLKKHR